MAELLSESPRRLVLNGTDQLVGELFRRNVSASFIIGFKNMIGDRLHQMCFSKPGLSVNKKRIVGFGRVISDGSAGRVGHAGGGSDDKIIEGETRLNIQGLRLFRRNCGMSNGIDGKVGR